MSRAMGIFGNDGRFKPVVGFSSFTGFVVSSKAADLAKAFEKTLNQIRNVFEGGNDIGCVRVPVEPRPLKLAKPQFAHLSAETEIQKDLPEWQLWIVPVKSLSQIVALAEIESMSKRLRKIDAGWVVGSCSVTRADKMQKDCVGIVVSGRFAEKSKDLKIGFFLDAGDYIRLQTPKN